MTEPVAQLTSTQTHHPAMADIRIEETEDAEPFTTCHEWLRDHNASYVTNKWIAVRLVAYDEDHGLVGSLDGQVGWGKLHVDNIVVQPGLRGGGIGRRLMEEAERIAALHGCSGVYLETMSFQALGFYERLGYVKVGELAGFENAAVQIYLHKPI